MVAHTFNPWQRQVDLCDQIKVYPAGLQREYQESQDTEKPNLKNNTNTTITKQTNKTNPKRVEST